MMTCRPQMVVSRSPMSLATRSVGPPAVYGTTKRTTRLGQTCACACLLASAGASIDAADSRSIRRRSIIAGLASLVHGDAGFLDHRTPFVHLGLEVVGKLRRRRADHHDAEPFEPLFSGGIGQRCDDIGVDFAH